MQAAQLPVPDVPRLRNTYHTDLKVAARDGSLPDDIKAAIPKSTVSNWRNWNPPRIIGQSEIDLIGRKMAPAERIDTGQRARMVEMLLAVCDLQREILAGIKGAKKALDTRKEPIVRIVREFCQTPEEQKLVLWALGIKRQQVQYWARTMKKCASSLTELCRNRHPNQLVPKEIRRLLKYLKDAKFACWPRIAIFHQMRRDDALHCGRSTFYKYCECLGFTRRSFRRTRPKKGIRASRPGELLHADVTETRLTGHALVHIHNLIDNFSRYAFTSTASLTKSAVIYRDSIERVISAYPETFTETLLLVDDGSENKAELAAFAGVSGVLLMMVAQKDVDFSNSMAEAYNKNLHGYIRETQFVSIETLQAFLDEARDNYNHRPQDALHASTPHEVFHGMVPDKHRFKEQTAAARKARVIENRSFNCGSCSAAALIG